MKNRNKQFPEVKTAEDVMQFLAEGIRQANASQGPINIVSHGASNESAARKGIRGIAAGMMAVAGVTLMGATSLAEAADNNRVLSKDARGGVLVVRDGANDIRYATQRIESAERALKRGTVEGIANIASGLASLLSSRTAKRAEQTIGSDPQTQLSPSGQTIGEVFR